MQATQLRGLHGPHELSSLRGPWAMSTTRPKEVTCMPVGPMRCPVFVAQAHDQVPPVAYEDWTFDKGGLNAKASRLVVRGVAVDL